ncbi:unnamed protein product, partial [Prorocentrum cordatum]
RRAPRRGGAAARAAAAGARRDRRRGATAASTAPCYAAFLGTSTRPSTGAAVCLLATALVHPAHGRAVRGAPEVRCRPRGARGPAVAAAVLGGQRAWSSYWRIAGAPRPKAFRAPSGLPRSPRRCGGSVLRACA